MTLRPKKQAIPNQLLPPTGTFATVQLSSRRRILFGQREKLKLRKYAKAATCSSTKNASFNLKKRRGKMKKQIHCHPTPFISIRILARITNYFHIIHEDYTLILALTASYCKRAKVRRDTTLSLASL